LIEDQAFPEIRESLKGDKESHMKKFPFCAGCPLESAPGPVLGEGVPGGLALVGEAPGREELQLGRPFVGRSGRLLRETLKQLGNPEVYITNAVLCYPGKEAAPPSQAIKCCSQRFWDDLSKASPRALLLLGNSAIKATFPDERAGVLKLRGGLLKVPKLGVYAIPTLHPSAVLRDPRQFRTFSRDVEKALRLLTTPPLLPEPPKIQKVTTSSQLLSLVSAASARPGKYAVLDLETTGFDPFVDKILRVGVMFSPETALIIYPSALTPFGVWQLKALLENSQIFWVGHNGGLFDSKFLKHHYGIDWRPSFDTLLAHYTVDEESQSHSLKQLAVDYFNAPLYREVLVKHQQSSDVRFAELPDEMLDQYLAWDLLFTWMLVPILQREMESEGTTQVHDRLLVPASLALRDVELTGILIDREYLERLGRDLEQSVSQKVDAIRREWGFPQFNPNSPKQVAQLLYDYANLPAPPGRSTEKEYLEKLEHPLVKEILEVRTIERLITTYVRGILQRLGPDGRIRTDFLLHRSSTGRLASSNPNLQNIPVLYGPQVRDAFIASPGWRLVEVDYSQLELRVAAWYSGDEMLCEAYRTGQDIHTLVASEIYKKPPEQVTKLERYMAKYVDFGILYGRGPKTLSEQIKCSVEEAAVYIERFFDRFHGIYRWLEEQRRLAIERGYVETPLGRRRRFSLITEDNLVDVKHQAGNSPIQSLASDLCLSSLIRLHRRLDPQVARILLTVHDSILLEVREGFLEEVIPIIVFEMTQNLPIEDRGVPFEIEIKTGQRWGSLKELEGNF
jgi:DNA polymerase-1